jgi:hypothetical protein
LKLGSYFNGHCNGQKLFKQDSAENVQKETLQETLEDIHFIAAIHFSKNVFILGKLTGLNVFVKELIDGLLKQIQGHYK